MDLMLYIAMSGAKQTLVAQTANTHNLANASTTGFRADFEAFRAMPVFGHGQPSRVYAMAERPGVDLSTGTVYATGRDLDVAVQGDGWIAVQAPDGREAYTRAGDLRVNETGLLTNGAGHPVLGNAGPITVPQAETLDIGADGTVSIRPLGQAPNTLTPTGEDPRSRRAPSLARAEAKTRGLDPHLPSPGRRGRRAEDLGVVARLGELRVGGAPASRASGLGAMEHRARQAAREWSSPLQVARSAGHSHPFASVVRNVARTSSIGRWDMVGFVVTGGL